MKLLGIGRFRSFAAAPVFPGPSQVRAYWEGLRIGGSIPERAALDPRGLTGALDKVFLAERIARGLVQVRIAGSALADMAATDLRGLPLSCLFSAAARPVLAEAVEAAATGAGLTELDLGLEPGGQKVVARLLLLPLADGADRQLVLGCFGFEESGLVGRAKFTILSRQDEALDPPPVRPVPKAKPAPVPVPSLRRVGHLSLVHLRD
jgi:hypothetical protein